jgi:hypothetical protein
MHIKYVVNQHHCDKIKDYFHFDHEIKKHFYFQYIKTCLWLGLNALKGTTSITLH